jgi:hypothetical protein
MHRTICVLHHGVVSDWTQLAVQQVELSPHLVAQQATHALRGRSRHATRREAVLEDSGTCARTKYILSDEAIRVGVDESGGLLALAVA